MACKCKPSSVLALVLISTMLLATGWQAVAGRHISTNTSNTQDKKEPQFMFPSDGSVYIPGIGSVGLPPFFGLTPQNPNTGGNGVGSGPAGGDDTFVPNPGSGGGVPAPVNP